MQVFDFTEGKKGKLLGNVGPWRRSEGWLVVKDDRVFKVELANPPKFYDSLSNWDWTTGVGVGSKETLVKPEDYGVEAICMCSGRYIENEEKIWQWYVVGTTEWNREACKKGILKSTFLREIEKEG